MLDQDDVWRVLDPLDEAGIWWVLEGGWGVDALVGEQTRSHGDLDPAIRWDALDRASGVLRGLGFTPVEDAWPGLPVRQLWRDRYGREVDLHPIQIDPAGNGWQGSDEWWGYYPADGLRGSGCIAGRPVRCITPDLQLRHHLGYRWREVDLHDMGLLQRRFGVWLPPPHDPRT